MWRDVRILIEGEFQSAGLAEFTFDHIITDPPYEAHMHRAPVSAASAAPLRAMRMDGREMPAPLPFAPVTDRLRADLCDLAARQCSGWLLLFCTAEGVAAWRDAIEAAGLRYKRAMPWVKPDSAPQMNGQGPAHCCEMIVAAWCGRSYSRWNGGGKRGEYRVPVNPKDRDGRHQTEKPQALMRALLADFTRPGDLICDPMMGGGSTCVAARAAHRGFVGVERDPAYFAVAADRLGAAQPGNGITTRTQKRRDEWAI